MISFLITMMVFINIGDTDYGSISMVTYEKLFRGGYTVQLRIFGVRFPEKFPAPLFVSG